MSFWKLGKRYAGITPRGKRFIVDNRTKALAKAGKSKAKTTKKKKGNTKSKVSRTMGKRKFTIPVGIVGPIVGSALWAYRSHDELEPRVRHFVNAYVPFADPDVPWDHRLQYGLYPLIIGALVHKVLGGMLGVNRMLGRAGVPVFRL